MKQISHAYPMKSSSYDQAFVNEEDERTWTRFPSLTDHISNVQSDSAPLAKC